MIFNTLPPAYTSETPSSKLFLRPTSYPTTNPPVPLARGITLARVASRAANDKRLADRVVKALRHALKETPNTPSDQPKPPPLLLKLHDLIAIHIDASEPDDEDSDSEDEGEQDKSAAGPDLDVEPPHPGARPRPTGENLVDEDEQGGLTPVFLKVVNLDYAPVALTNGSSSHSNTSNSSPDRITSATSLGELGCLVDPNSTRVAMVGVEHGLVPCLEQFDEEDQDDDGDVESGKSAQKKRFRTAFDMVCIQS